MRAREVKNGHNTEASFARSLSSLLLGLGFEKWNDRTGDLFADALRKTIEQIEQNAIDTEEPNPTVAPILEIRIEHLVAKLRKIAGAEKTDRMLDLLKQNEDRK